MGRKAIPFREAGAAAALAGSPHAPLGDIPIRTEGLTKALKSLSG
jgi:hypothetical protein